VSETQRSEEADHDDLLGIVSDFLGIFPSKSHGTVLHSTSFSTD